MAIIGQISTSQRAWRLWWCCWYCCCCFSFSFSLNWSVYLKMVFSCWKTAPFVFLLLLKTDGSNSSPEHKGIEDRIWGQNETHVTLQIGLHIPWHFRVHVLFFHKNIPKKKKSFRHSKVAEVPNNNNKKNSLVLCVCPSHTKCKISLWIFPSPTLKNRIICDDT